jgi:hypothetical protein
MGGDVRKFRGLSLIGVSLARVFLVGKELIRISHIFLSYSLILLSYVFYSSKNLPWVPRVR